VVIVANTNPVLNYSILVNFLVLISIVEKHQHLQIEINAPSKCRCFLKLNLMVYLVVEFDEDMTSNDTIVSFKVSSFLYVYIYNKTKNWLLSFSIILNILRKNDDDDDDNKCI
jgi:hypothetical protein